MRGLLYILFFLPSLLLAQDIHFSQWMHNPLQLSPALTAYFDGDYRLTAHQRGQWASVSIPFNTTTIGVERSFKKVGLGLQFSYDQAGSSRLQNNQLNLSIAVPLADWRLGAMLGFGQRTIDYTDLQFGVNETFPSQSVSYADMGLGIFRALSLSYDKVLSLGVSALHLNSPNRSLVSEEDLLPIRTQAFAELEWALQTEWSVFPSLMLMDQQPHRELSVGARTTYDISEAYQKEIQLEGGVFHRLGDAVSVLLGVYWEDTHIALNYDWNISNLIPASNGLGAWEVSFTHILQQSIPKRPGYRVCPVYL